MTITHTWQTVDATYDMSQGETVSRISEDLTLKNIDGKFQVIDCSNFRVSPEFDYESDAIDWAECHL